MTEKELGRALLQADVAGLGATPDPRLLTGATDARRALALFLVVAVLYVYRLHHQPPLLSP